MDPPPYQPEEFVLFVGEPYDGRHHVAWLSGEELFAFSQWKNELYYILPLYTVLFTAIHFISYISTEWMDISAMPLKDRRVWHNKVVSTFHAAAALVLGLYWLAMSPEPSMISNKAFAFLPLNAHMAAFGAGYFVYDFFAMIALRNYMSPAFFIGVIVHHIIFILAYMSTLVIPCTLSVTTYHLFQLTELSTVFLHLSWMATKSLVQYYTLFSLSLVLLATFVVRVINTVYIVFHVVTRLLDLRLWMVDIPEFSWKVGAGYSIFFVIGSSGMLFINLTWLSQLVARAKEMINRVRDGKPPTRDYERTLKSD